MTRRYAEKRLEKLEQDAGIGGDRCVVVYDVPHDEPEDVSYRNLMKSPQAARVGRNTIIVYLRKWHNLSDTTLL